MKIADGKIYAYNGEHTPSEPYDRGWSLYCINATNGQLIWKIINPMAPGAIADGYLTAANGYDGTMYVFGKGKTTTTVTAPDTVVTKGTGLVIKGTVMDQSPAQPNTPCISVDTMTTQMQYLHLQQPIDGIWHNESIKAVPVTLTAIGSDGTVIDIGTTTTNGYYGTFGYTWTPESEGQYTIMASFAGDGSYGSSAAATVAVGAAPATSTPAPTQIAQIDYTPTMEMYIVGTGIAIIIAVALVGALVLKKR